MFAMPRFLPSSSPIWRRPLGLAAAALAFAACGGDDPSSGPDAAPPPGPRIERLATDVCGQLNRSVTASFMHEGVIYLGCTGGALGSAWFRYDTATGQSVAIDDIVGAAFCNVTKRDVTLTYTECANPSSTPDIYQRAIIPGGLGPAVRVIERAPTSPLFFAESDRTFYVMGYDSGRLALWHLVRSDFEPPSLQVAVRIDSSVSVRGIIGGPDGVYVLEDSAGDSTLRYYPEHRVRSAHRCRAGGRLPGHLVRSVPGRADLVLRPSGRPAALDVVAGHRPAATPHPGAPPAASASARVTCSRSTPPPSKAAPTAVIAS